MEVKRRQVLETTAGSQGGEERQRRMLLGGGLPLALPPLGQRGPDCKAMTYAMAPGALSRGAGRATNSLARCPRCIEFAGKILDAGALFQVLPRRGTPSFPPKGGALPPSGARLAVDLGLGGPGRRVWRLSFQLWEMDAAGVPARASPTRLFKRRLRATARTLPPQGAENRGGLSRAVAAAQADRADPGAAAASRRRQVAWPPAGRPPWGQEERRPVVSPLAGQRRPDHAALAVGFCAACGELPHRRGRPLLHYKNLFQYLDHNGTGGGHLGAPRGPENWNPSFAREKVSGPA